jgi:hypothetical protein
MCAIIGATYHNSPKMLFSLLSKLAFKKGMASKLVPSPIKNCL